MQHKHKHAAQAQAQARARARAPWVVGNLEGRGEEPERMVANCHMHAIEYDVESATAAIAAIAATAAHPASQLSSFYVCHAHHHRQSSNYSSLRILNRFSPRSVSRASHANKLLPPPKHSSKNRRIPSHDNSTTIPRQFHASASVRHV
ncbi:hypothetical protein K504DRAFT_46466 [Pleomassaria siparia CBS 279.74]|uniref:Uncharacterized protein n=1 Tax=Pleomassaria siparia CBS 279.74 TaxID=1314801 RepID=A0A6G1K4T5_9PLEO|nr:hypothetical protein K504DRAFT_46466 [Pleomassaria siparia CBS 279.74]